LRWSAERKPRLGVIGTAVDASDQTRVVIMPSQRRGIQIAFVFGNAVAELHEFEVQQLSWASSNHSHLTLDLCRRPRFTEGTDALAKVLNKITGLSETQ
jgi:hypothetical protein